jgi:hypothetical protein
MSPSDPAPRRRFFPVGRRPSRPRKGTLEQVTELVLNPTRFDILEALIGPMDMTGGEELSAAEMSDRLRVSRRSVVDRAFRQLVSGGFVAVRSLAPSGRPTGARVRRYAFINDVVRAQFAIVAADFWNACEATSVDEKREWIRVFYADARWLCQAVAEA